MIGWSWCDWLPHVIESIEQGEFEMNEQQYQPGDPIWWLHECRGGWGYVERVIAIVVKPGKSRIGIAVLLKDRQTWIPKYVKIENIRSREV